MESISLDLTCAYESGGREGTGDTSVNEHKLGSMEQYFIIRVSILVS